VHGDIYTKWASMGYELGALGYPTSDEINFPGASISYFQGGEIDQVLGLVQARVGFGKANEFNFDNFKFNVSIPLVEDAFGDQSYYSIWNPVGDDVHIPTPATVTFTAFGVAAVNHTGACFGMALTSLELYHHPD